MLLYHPTAKTTYVIRKEIHDNPENLTQVELAEKFNVTVSTVVKWQNRECFEDAPHGTINPKKSITDLEEYIICEIRKTPIECLESWFNEKPELFKVDIETFKNAERGLYLNDYRKGFNR